jgi:hypothetical protein
MTNAAQQIDIVGAVVAPAAPSLEWLDLRETRLPKPEHVLWQVQLARNFTDRSERVWPL